MLKILENKENNLESITTLAKLTSLCQISQKVEDDVKAQTGTVRNHESMPRSKTRPPAVKTTIEYNGPIWIYVCSIYFQFIRFSRKFKYVSIC